MLTAWLYDSNGKCLLSFVDIFFFLLLSFFLTQSNCLSFWIILLPEK